MREETPISPIRMGGRFGRWIGAAMLAHFVFVLCVIIWRREAPGEVLWLSHMSLLLSGLGLVLQSALLVATALTAVGILHGLWLLDSLPGLTLGYFPLGATTYLLTSDVCTVVATAHHFYMAPLLFTIVWRHGAYPKAALPMACLLWLVLTVTSRIAVPPIFNVNFAFCVPMAADHPFIAWINQLDAVSYLLILNVLVSAATFLPLVVLMRLAEAGRQAKRQIAAQTTLRQTKGR